MREVYPQTGHAAVIGLTGPPGAGKSTLIGALIKPPRAPDRQVAVLSIDPSSPFPTARCSATASASTEHFLDPGVFIRSMANRGALGGLSEAALQAALLMDAAGKDDVFLETVGVGQAEVDIIDHADTVVLVLMPGSGDSIQALKAGIMEIPDVIVVNKADHPLTDTMVREIRGVLSLAPQRGWRVPIVKTEAVRGEGVEALVEQLDAHRAYIEGGHARRAPPAQPAQRGSRAAHLPPAPRPRGTPGRGRGVREAARRGRRPPPGPRQRREHDPRRAPSTRPTPPAAPDSRSKLRALASRRKPRRPTR